MVYHDSHRLAEQRVAAIAEGVDAPSFASGRSRQLKSYRLDKSRLTRHMGDQAMDLFGCYQCAVKTDLLGRIAREKQAVAVAEQGFRAGAVDDRAAVDVLTDHECNACGEVGFDQPGDYIDRWPLGCKHEVYPDCAGHLRQAGDRFLRVPGSGQHQVGEFIDDHHDVGHLGRQGTVFVRPDLVFLEHAVEFGDSARARFRENIVPLLHFVHNACQHRHGAFRGGGDYLVDLLDEEEMVTSKFRIY